MHRSSSPMARTPPLSRRSASPLPRSPVAFLESCPLSCGAPLESTYAFTTRHTHHRVLDPRVSLGDNAHSWRRSGMRSWLLFQECLPF